MTGSKKTDGSVSFGKIGKVYRETLGQISNTAYKHVRLLNEHVLFADGHLKRSVSVIIQALEDDVSKYYWRIPLADKQIKVTGVYVSPNKDIEQYNVCDSDDLSLIEITTRPLKKHEKLQLQFEYYVTNACEVVKDGLFFKKLRYPFAYKPTSVTESFEFRLLLPRNGNVKIISNLPTPETFAVGDNQLIIASEEQFNSGDVMGELFITFRTKSYLPLVSLALGSLSTLLLAIVKYGDEYIGVWHILLIAIILSFLFYFATKVLQMD